MKQPTNNTPKNEDVKIHPFSTKSPHFWWLICLLSAIILFLGGFIITKRVIGSERLMEYVSVCSVLLSITLSIFAIQYTYTSNNEIHQQFEKINAAAEIIKETSKSLSETNALLNDNLEQILDKLENVDQSQQVIVNQINDITNRVPIIETKVSNLRLNNISQQG